MSKERRVNYRYSISFKQKVVKEIEEEGLSHTEAARRYQIKGAETIRNWLKAFGKNHLLNKTVRIEMKGEQDRVKELEQEIKKLKIALADAYLARDCAETIIDLANEEYKTDLKKNFAPDASSRKKNTTQ